MFYFKSCIKCHGDQTLEKDSFGAYLKCLQCGTYTEVKETQGQQSVLNGSVSITAKARSVAKAKSKTAVAA